MGVFLGDNELKSAHLDGLEVQKVYLESSLVYPVSGDGPLVLYDAGNEYIKITGG